MGWADRAAPPLCSGGFSAQDPSSIAKRKAPARPENRSRRFDVIVSLFGQVVRGQPIASSGIYRNDPSKAPRLWIVDNKEKFLKTISCPKGETSTKLPYCDGKGGEGKEKCSIHRERQICIVLAPTFGGPNSLSGCAYTKKPRSFEQGFFVYGAPGEIRTPDQVVRSHLLYPAELRVRDLR
jgi:hypothetical protein